MSTMNASPARTAEAAPARLTRVMIVDDSAVIRGLLARWIKEDSDIDVVASVANGALAVKAIGDSAADVVVLDIEMPEMDGLTALPKLLEKAPGLKVIMASTLTRRNAEISIKALAMGAADYIAKPTASSELHAADGYRVEILRKIRALGEAAIGAARPAATRPGAGAGSAIRLRRIRPMRPRALAVGSSTGGPQALLSLFSQVDISSLPVFVVQHMPATFTAILAEHIQRANDVVCAEAARGETAAPGRIYVAPGDYHMTVFGTPGRFVIGLNQEQPENFCRSAVDVLFRSLAVIRDSNVLAVVLTGMGADGLKGGQALISAGCNMVAQDEESSVVWGMPGAVATAGLCCDVVPIADIGARFNQLLRGVS